MTPEEQKRFDEQYAKHGRALKLQGIVATHDLS
jgi:hypothetical protein